MNVTFEEYIKDVKSQLCCNNPEIVDFITYDYSEQQIDENLDYFKECLDRNRSGYKALLFLYDYLLEK